MQYTGTVVWSPIDGIFKNSTVYFAIITLIPKNGYTLQGVPTDFFTVPGANRVNNDENSCVITAVFPKTAGTVDNPAVGEEFFTILVKKNNVYKIIHIAKKF